uniref:C2H2-type domain-containing protein n=1 Tax=Amorphochlora amoebiformis TaxID=1561963 RepID=A0A6T6TM10_9EUKA|mmetsp:Transcript_19758/g.31358  ORF Transcript_19758/g.31358 Transcript_19758/m.31358 type:complete len:238 (+) Transcript_19758:130-843(+)
MEKFGKKTQLRRHQETHEGMLPYVCRETAASGQACGEAFRTPNDLRRHKVHVHGKRRHVCGVDGCAMRFIRFAELTGHRREAHPELSIVQCPECAQIFRDRDALRKHRVSHQKKYVCGEQGCGKAFSTSYNLKTHVNMVHLRIKPFKCDVSGCAKTFSTKGSLKRHKSKIHTPKAPEELKAQEGQRRAKKRARLLDKICGKDITRSDDEVKVTQVQQQQIRKKARLLDEICRAGNSR